MQRAEAALGGADSLTLLHHGSALLGDSFDAGLVPGNLGLQGLMLLQQILDSDQVLAWKQRPLPSDPAQRQPRSSLPQQSPGDTPN